MPLGSGWEDWRRGAPEIRTHDPTGLRSGLDGECMGVPARPFRCLYQSNQWLGSIFGFVSGLILPFACSIASLNPPDGPGFRRRSVGRPKRHRAVDPRGWGLVSSVGPMPFFDSIDRLGCLYAESNAPMVEAGQKRGKQGASKDRIEAAVRAQIPPSLVVTCTWREAPSLRIRVRPAHSDFGPCMWLDSIALGRPGIGRGRLPPQAKALGS